MHSRPTHHCCAADGLRNNGATGANGSCVRSEAGEVVGEWYEAHRGAALVHLLGVLERPRPPRAVPVLQLGPVHLALAGVEPHPVGEVGEIGRR